MVGASAGDSVAWTQGACADVASGVSTTCTSVYAVSSVNESFVLHPTAAVGLWKFCHKPSAQGLWTHVTDVALEIIDQITDEDRAHSPAVMAAIGSVFCSGTRSPY